MLFELDVDRESLLELLHSLSVDWAKKTSLGHVLGAALPQIVHEYHLSQQSWSRATGAVGMPHMLVVQWVVEMGHNGKRFKHDFGCSL